MMTKECMSLPDKEYFVRLISLFFGIWLFYVGVMKWKMGADQFVGMITSQFDPTWSPHQLNVILAWIIMVAEPVLAALLILGKKPRMVWTLVALFMFMLTFGQTMLMQQEGIANTWQYLALACACAALSKPCEACCKASG